MPTALDLEGHWLTRTKDSTTGTRLIAVCYCVNRFGWNLWKSCEWLISLVALPDSIRTLCLHQSFLITYGRTEPGRT
jgi:hypothetical protein